MAVHKSNTNLCFTLNIGDVNGDVDDTSDDINGGTEGKGRIEHITGVE